MSQMGWSVHLWAISLTVIFGKVHIPRVGKTMIALPGWQLTDGITLYINLPGN